MAISTAKLREEVLALTGMKVDIMLNDEEFKSTYQIMEEISRVWKDIADVDQAALLELLGGKRQANILSSMLTNFEVAQESLSKAMDSAGSAMAENEKYLDSIGGKLKQLEAAWESLSATVLSSELVKGVLDLAIGLTQAIDKIISALGSAEAVVGSAIVGISAKKGIGGIFTAITKGSGVAEAAMLGLKGGFVGLGIALAAIVGIKIGKWLWDIYDGANQAEQGLADVEERVNGLANKRKDFSDLASQFETMSKQRTLSPEENQEYIDIQNQLHELLPSLKGYYDERGNFIITETNQMKDLVAIYDQYYQQSRRGAINTYLTGMENGHGTTKSVYKRSKEELAGYRLEKLEIQDYLALAKQYETDPSSFLPSEEERLGLLEGEFGNIDAANARLRELNSLIDQSVIGMRDKALEAMSISNIWTEITEEEKNALSAVINSLDDASLDAFFDVFLDPEQDVIDWLRDTFPQEVQHALDNAQKQAENATSGSITPHSSPSLAKSQANLMGGMKILEEGVKSLGDAYKEFVDKGALTATTLQELSGQFGNCGEEWNNFMSLISSGSATTQQMSDALDNLIAKFIQQGNITGDVTEETVGLLTQLLESVGVVNAEEVAIGALVKKFYDLGDAKKLAEIADFKNMTEDEAVELNNEGTMGAYAAKMVAYLAMQEALCSGNGFATAIRGKTNELRAYAAALGWTAEERALFNDFEEAEALAQSNVDTERAEGLQQQEELRKQLLALWENTEFPTPNFDWSSLPPGAKDTTDKISAEFQSMYDQLQAMREANLISEEEYLQRLFELNQQYNRNNVSAYRQYAMEIFNGMKSMMADRITAKYDSQISSLESERAEAERYYDGLIDAEQDKLDLLRQEWETEEHLLKIEKARAELARAQQQKNVRVYREGKGFVWEADQEKVQDATATVNNALKEYERYQKELAIEKRIEQLEELKEKVLESIDQQIEAARRAKEEALKNLEELQFGAEAFLQFLEMFGIEVDDKTLAMIKSFDLMAEQSGLSLDDTKKSIGQVGEALKQLYSGESIQGIGGTSALGNQGAPDGKSNPGTGVRPEDIGNSEAYSKYGILADFMAGLDVFKEDILVKLQEIEKAWLEHTEAIKAHLKLLIDEGIVATEDATLSMVEKVTVALDELTEVFATFSLTSVENLKPMLDSFNKLFVGEIENPFESSDKEVLNWFEYFLIGLEELIAKFHEWWDEHLIPYMEYVEEKHDWLVQAVQDEIDLFETWRDTLIDALQQVKDMIEALIPLVENAKLAMDELSSSFIQITGTAQAASGAVGVLAAAINALQSKTVTIDVITRHSTVGEPSIETTKSAGGTIKETTKSAGGTIKETINPDGSISTKRYASGVIGLSSNQWALTDEEGPELVIPGKGTFRRLKMGSSVLPADVSRNLWVIGQNPMGFAAGIANMISNRKEDNKTYQVNVGDIILHEVQNARRVADELKGLVLKAEQLAYSK